METVTLTIDGRQVTVEKGKTVLQAAIENSVSVPYYCYHPGIGVDGSCRVCIVKIEKMPKLQTSCSTTCTDGMVVSTRTQEVIDERLRFDLLATWNRQPAIDQHHPTRALWVVSRKLRGNVCPERVTDEQRSFNVESIEDRQHVANVGGDPVRARQRAARSTPAQVGRQKRARVPERPGHGHPRTAAGRDSVDGQHG